MILPQNTEYFDLNQTLPNDLYPMRCEAWHIHAFQVPEDSFVKVMISLISVDCEDLTLQGYFSDTPLGQTSFFGNSTVSNFSIKKNYAFGEEYYGNHASIFTIYDVNYNDYDDSPVIEAGRIPNTNTIETYLTGPDPKEPSVLPVKKILEVASRLKLMANKTYYLNLHNLQNKDKVYKLLFSTETPKCEQMDNPCVPNLRESESNNLYPYFRYPSDNRPGW